MAQFTPTATPPHNTPTLHHADYLTALNTLTATPDLYLIDPPYGVTKNPWDTPIDLTELWAAIDNHRHPRTVVIFIATQPYASKVVASNFQEFRYDLIWEADRPTGFLNANRMPMRSHHSLLVFYQRLPTYNPQKWEGEPLHGRGTRERVNNNYGELRDDEWTVKAGTTAKHPRSVIKIPRPHPAKHPTEKPPELYRWLIRTYSNKGNLVADPFLGSGNSAEAAIEEGRQFWGCDIVEEYVDAARERLEG
jgi:site-specific DNA-methyltransferase (adenine-specific)